MRSLSCTDEDMKSFLEMLVTILGDFVTSSDTMATLLDFIDGLKGIFQFILLLYSLMTDNVGYVDSPTLGILKL